MKKLLLSAMLVLVPQMAFARHYSYDEGHIVPHPAGCPWVASCGCIASVKVFGHPVRDLYSAANWGRFPSAAPAPGMAAYRADHVFIIEQVTGPGTVLAYDGNSGGHLTRIHQVSLAGYRVVDPHGGSYASNSGNYRRTRHRRVYADASAGLPTPGY